MTYKVTNIKYDTDGEDVNLPNELEITVPDNIQSQGYEATEQYISDEISNKTGFCHEGFSTTPKISE
jgi:hypothetical protein